MDLCRFEYGLCMAWCDLCISNRVHLSSSKTPFPVDSDCSNMLQKAKFRCGETAMFQRRTCPKYDLVKAYILLHTCVFHVFLVTRLELGDCEIHRKLRMLICWRCWLQGTSGGNRNDHCGLHRTPGVTQRARVPRNLIETDSLKRGKIDRQLCFVEP